MKQLIDMDNLKIYMRSEGLLTENDMSRLQVLPPHNTPDSVVLALATIVQQKGQSGMTRFMSALCRSADEEHHSGHEELYQILHEDMSSSTSHATTSMEQGSLITVSGGSRISLQVSQHYCKSIFP